MRAEQALLGAHFSQAKKVLGRNLQSASFSKSARIFAEQALKYVLLEMKVHTYAGPALKPN